MILFIFFSIFFSLKTQAKPLEEGKIFKIDYGNTQEVPLVYLDNGRVIEIKKNLSKDFSQLEEAKKNSSLVVFEINNKNQIINFKITNKSLGNDNVIEDHKSEFNSVFIPTIIDNFSYANQLFQSARRNFNQNSQCYDRAHIWAYEWRINNNLYTSKAWVFFTQKYIRNYKFEWWFHVAPLIHVAIENEVKERVMDIKYSKRPEKLNNWTNNFIRNNEPCPVVTRFSDYANFPESGSCFVMKSSMYQYIPLDLEEEELTGVSKVKWLESEIKQAYLNGFNLSTP